MCRMVIVCGYIDAVKGISLIVHCPLPFGTDFKSKQEYYTASVIDRT